jgi:hypothetical protein
MKKSLSSVIFVASLSVSVNPSHAAAILWDRGAGNNNLSAATNWDGDVAPGSSDIAELRGVGPTNNGYNVNSESLSWGGLLVNANQSNFWNINSAVSSGEAQGTITVSGVVIGAFANAAVVNNSANGGGIRSNLVLDGGGSFVIAHNSTSGFEIDGTLSESGGSASLIVDGLGVDGARVVIRGNNTAEPVFQLSGSIVVQNGANLRVNDAFDISATGGTLTVDATSRWSLGSAVNWTVAGMTVDSVVFGPGIYGKSDFDAAGVGGRFESSSGTITVVPEPVVGFLASIGMLGLIRRRR